MKIIIKRLWCLRSLAIFLFMVAVFFLAGTQKISAAEQQKTPYLIQVNRVHNTITIYEKDEEGKYSIPIKAMICSVGEKGMETKQGTFKTKAKYRWKLLMGNVWGQYSTRIVGGILFHSVYYYKNGNPASLATREYNKLGTAASHGCIRLTVADAKWIYDNCAVGTTVVIYDDKKIPGPLGKPEGIKIPTSVRWDPTDPNNKNPYKDKMPKITGIKDVTISWGDEIDLLKGVKATSSLGTDISSKVIINGEINSYHPGDYDITYSVRDALGRTGIKKRNVTVEECAETPKFEGIGDKVVGEEVIIDEEYALTDIEVYCLGIKLDKNDIEVTIENISEIEYFVTYQISIGQTATATEYATIYIDNEAPVFSGISDRLLTLGEVPDLSYAMSGVTVSDQYSEMDQNGILVTITENTDGSYQVTYEAADEVGNVAISQVLFHY